MIPQTFIIKSPLVQDTIMLSSLGVVVFFLFRGLVHRQSKHVLVSVIWVFIVFWFFNSPFFGFSKVTLNSQGIRLDYGILSFRNTTLPRDTPWKIETYLSGIKKTKRLYFIRIGDRESMKVQGRKDYQLLEGIGKALESMEFNQKARAGCLRYRSGPTYLRPRFLIRCPFPLISVIAEKRTCLPAG